MGLDLIGHIWIWSHEIEQAMYLFFSFESSIIYFPLSVPEQIVCLRWSLEKYLCEILIHDVFLECLMSMKY